jgi:MFS family permease
VRPRGVLSEPAFRLYFVGQAANFIGESLRTLAIPLLVFHMTGSGLSVGIAYASQYLPFALGGLVGGSLADRLDRRQLMLVCNAVRGVLLAALALLVGIGRAPLAVIYGVVAAISLSDAVFIGGESSSVPFVVGKERVANAIAALLAAEQSANLVAPPIGGALFAVGGAVPALLLNAVTYFISFAALWQIPTLGPDCPGPPPRLRDVALDAAGSFRFLWEETAMRAITLLSLGLNLFGMMAGAVYIPFFKKVLGAGDAQIGLTLGIIALGSVAGSIAAGPAAARWPFGRSLCLAYALDGLLFLPVMFSHRLWTVVTFWALASAGAAFETASIIAWRMRVIPQAKMARVFGVVKLVALIGIVPGTIAGGLLADLGGARLPIAVSSLGYLVLALAATAMPVVRREAR